MSAGRRSVSKMTYSPVTWVDNVPGPQRPVRKDDVDRAQMVDGQPVLTDQPADAARGREATDAHPAVVVGRLSLSMPARRRDWIAELRTDQLLGQAVARSRVTASRSAGATS
jgi:hypothetical protein